MNRIRKLRESLGMTQSQLGEVVGKSLHAVSKWEIGRNQPSQEDLIKMSRLFNVDLAYLIGAENTPSTKINGEQNNVGELKRLQNEIEVLFKGGKLPPEDKDEFIKVITEMYWDAKEKQKGN